nr:MAG TPA: hypothetical protein [Caudoviricetes sp.]
MAVSIGPKIGIDGEAEYRKQIYQIIQQAKTLKSEMDAVASSFTKETSAEEKNRATKAVLTRQIEAQEQKTKLLARMVEESAKATGENSTETLKWKDQLNKATAELGKMNRQMEDLDGSLDDTSDGFSSNQKAAKKFGDTLDDTKITAADFGDILRANILSDAIVSGFEKLAGYAKDFATGSIEAAANANALASQMEQTFGALKGEASDAIGRVAKNSGILETRLQGAAAQIYAFARSSGGDTTESLQLMETALQAAADSAAYYDKSLDDTVETLQSFLKGNYSNDAALGLSATETTRNTAATKLFRKEYNKLTEIQKQKVLLSMVTDAQKLSGAMGQAAREADGWENVQGNLNESVKQFQAQVGKPVLKNLIPIVQEITRKFSAWQKSVDWSKFGRQVSSAFDFLLENGEKIAKTVGVVGGSFLAISGGIKTFNGLATAGKTLVAVLGAGGGAVGIAGAAVAAAAGIGILLSRVFDARYQTAELNKIEKDNISTLSQLRDSYQSVSDSAAEKAKGELAEVAHLQNLAKELDLLVDANGKVNEANRTRATFILGELSEALGKEYQLTGDQIKGYDDLKKSVSDYVETRKAEILLAEAEAKYTEAKTQKADVEKGIYKQRQIMIQREIELKEANRAVMKRIEKYGSRAYDFELRNLERIAGQKKLLYQESVNAYAEFSKQYDQINQDIQSYETASAELMQGHAEKTIEILDKQNRAFKTAQDVALADAEEKKRILGEQYEYAEGILEEYQKRYVAGIEGYTAEGLAILEQNAKDAAEEARKVGVEIATGTEAGAKSQLPSLEEALKSGLFDVTSGLTFDVNDDAQEIGKTLTSGVSAGAQATLAGMDETLKRNFSGVTSGILGNVGVDGQQIGKALTSGTESGAKSQIPTLEAALKSSFGEVTSGLSWDASKDAQDIGKNIADGTEKGFNSKKWTLKARITSYFQDMVKGVKKALGIASPSKVFAEIGKFTAEGYTIGLEKTMAKDMRSIQSAFELSADVAAAAAAPQPVTYATTEYGGFTINVNAAPGQSEEAIADAVSARIQQQINRREAVW